MVDFVGKHPLSELLNGNVEFELVNYNPNSIGIMNYASIEVAKENPQEI